MGENLLRCEKHAKRLPVCIRWYDGEFTATPSNRQQKLINLISHVVELSTIPCQPGYVATAIAISSQA